MPPWPCIRCGHGGIGHYRRPFDQVLESAEGRAELGELDLALVVAQLLGLRLENHQVRKVIASYVGENKLFTQQYLDHAIEVVAPQGTLAERPEWSDGERNAVPGQPERRRA